MGEDRVSLKRKAGVGQQTNRTATTSKTNGKQPLGAAYHLNLLPRFAGEGMIMNPLR